MGLTKVQPSLDVRRVRGTSAAVTAVPYPDLGFVAGVYTFANAIPPKKQSQTRSWEVRSARLLDPQDVAPPTAGWALALCRRLPVVASANAVALDLLDAEADYILDFIHFPATTRSHVMDLGSSQLYKCSMPNGPITGVLDDIDADGVISEDLSIYGILQVLGAWTSPGTTAPLIDLMVVAD